MGRATGAGIGVGWRGAGIGVGWRTAPGPGMGVGWRVTAGDGIGVGCRMAVGAGAGIGVGARGAGAGVAARLDVPERPSFAGSKTGRDEGRGVGARGGSGGISPTSRSGSPAVARSTCVRTGFAASADGAGGAWITGCGRTAGAWMTGSARAVVASGTGSVDGAGTADEDERSAIGCFTRRGGSFQRVVTRGAVSSACLMSRRVGAPP
jgi:hypothetical protein